MERTQPQFIGALATNILVGREHERQAIERAVSRQAGFAFQLIALVAPGGIGKTRLIREAYRLATGRTDVEETFSPRGKRQPGTHQPNQLAGPEPDGVICLRLIDLADPTLHRDVAFLREVRQRFEEQLHSAAAYFARFDSALEAYDERRDKAAPYQEIQQLKKKLGATFYEDYQALAQQYRVVWLIDTMEQLYGVPEKIENLLTRVGTSEEDIEQTTYRWLIRFAGLRPANTTLLLAGRPEPGRWISDIRGVCGRDDGFHEFELEPFSLDETNQYFATLSRQLAVDGYESFADYLDSMQMDPERPLVMYLLTAGNPIRLALYIDMVTSIAEEPKEFQQSLADLQALSGDELQELRNRVDDQLLAHIERGLVHPENVVLAYLFVSRRGLNTARLQRLWDATPEQSEQVIKHLRRLSFVKQRYGKLFLHDELYDMYARRLSALRQSDPEVYKIAIGEMRETCRRIIRFCEDQVAQTTHELAERVAQPADEDPSDPQALDAQRLSRRALRRYKAEALHYRLYLDPQTAFNVNYYMLAEQALIGQDDALDGYLESEIEAFFFGTTAHLNRQLAEIEQPEWGTLQLTVMEERWSRWVKRLTLLYQKFPQAQSFAEHLIPDYAQLIAADYQRIVLAGQGASTATQRSHVLFEDTVEAYRLFAAIYQGTDISATTRSLDGVIKRLEAAVRQEGAIKQAKTRLLNVIAQGYSFAGYGYTLVGSYRLAEDRYERAYVILRRTQHDALRAEVVNNLGRVLGELGYQYQALQYCEDGLQLRKKLGFDYLIGLSLNTESLILTRNARPTPGIKPAEDALKLFRQLNNPRGEVLAATQLAQAKRRSWRLNPDPSRIGLLEDAERHLKDAEDVFATRANNEHVRRIETYLEMGALYRDFADLFNEGPGDPHFDAAVRYLDMAQAAAQGITHHQYVLAAIVNKAYLYHYCGLADRAEQLVAEALASTPPEYLLTRGRVLDLSNTANLAIFAQLSKLFALRATLFEVTRDAFPRLVEYHVLATMYSQLFSKAEHWYLRNNATGLRTLLNTYALFTEVEEERMVQQVIEAYRLRELAVQPDIGPLQIESVLQELIASHPELDYLDT